MQTFMPYGNYEKVAKTLDYRRLGKQRVEGMQTHNQLTKSQKIEAGAGEDVIRLSVGLEDVKDLIKDLNQALARL